MEKKAKKLNYIRQSPVLIKSGVTHQPPRLNIKTSGVKSLVKQDCVTPVKCIFVVLSLVYLAIHLVIANDYALSWDFHYHHYAGLYHLGREVPKLEEPALVPFSSPDPRLTVEDPFGPFTQIIPSLSYVVFYEELGLLPFDLAYNLPIIIFGAAGVLLLYLFLYEAGGFWLSLAGGTFLALFPSYFGYLHNNMKDIPNAFAFALSIYFFWRLERERDLKNLFLSVAAFAFAFNVKVNSIMIPVILLIWVALFNISEIVKFISSVVSPSEETIRTTRRRDFDGIKLVLSYFILAPTAAILLWWPFWDDPLGKLLSIPSFYSQNTLNMPVLFAGEIFRSGVNIPWHYPYVYILITTPLPILFSFIIGLFIVVKDTIKRNKFSTLLLLWFFVPLLRYFNPKMGAIDGVRHFMEVVYPLSAISAVGTVYFIWVAIKKVGRKVILATIIVSLTLLVYNLYHFHPYQTSFFNRIVGGIKGAWGEYDIDFWGSPQKEAMLWLNSNASSGSKVHIVMGQATAATYLREDLRVLANSDNMWESDYTVLLNRESFFSIYGAKDYINSKTLEDIVYSVEIDDVPLVWVFRNRTFGRKNR